MKKFFSLCTVLLMLFVSSASALTLPVADKSNANTLPLVGDTQSTDIINFEKIDGQILDVAAPTNMFDTRAWPGSGGAAQVSKIEIGPPIDIGHLGSQYQGHIGVSVRVTGHGRDYASYDGKKVEYVQRKPFIISGTAADGWDYIFDCGPLSRGTHRFELKMVSINWPYTEIFSTKNFSF